MLIVIAGAPATGKTTIALELSQYLEAQYNEVVFNLEIDKIRSFVLGDVNHYNENISLWFSLLIQIFKYLQKEKKTIIIEGLFYNVECLDYFKDLKDETNFILLKTTIDVCLQRNKMRSKVLPDFEVRDLFKIGRPSYLNEIDSTGSKEETLEKVIRFLQLGN